MGIYDREYCRDGSRGYLDSLYPEGRVCKLLILVHVAVFGLQLLAPSLTQLLSLTLDQFPADFWRVLTYSFLHEVRLPPWTLLWNMLFLWWFGSDLEQMYGSVEFLFFYLLAALIGGLAFLGFAAAGGGETAVAFGPSGAITALLVVFACHFPSHTVRFLFFLPIPIWLMVTIQILGSFYLDQESVRGSFALSLGGGLFGGMYYKKQWRLSGFLESLRKVRVQQRPKLRVFAPEPVAEPVSVAAPKPMLMNLDEHLEAKVDAVLEKMARSGKESLTDNERQVLLRASEMYRKKRT